MSSAHNPGAADRACAATLPLRCVLAPAIGLLAVLTVITGFLYPLAVWLLAGLAFPHQAHGSLIRDHGRILGSELIGQNFSRADYFWPRPSATAPGPNNAESSGGSNLGPRNPALRQAILTRIAALRAADPGNRAPIPIDLVTASGSGIDPDISLDAARYQLPRIARLRQMPAAAVEHIVEDTASAGSLGLTPAHVNVLALNRALDRLQPGQTFSGGETK